MNATPNLVHSAALLSLVGATSTALLWLAYSQTSVRGESHQPALSPWALGWLAWQALIAALALSGFFAVYDQPWRALPTVGATLALTAWLALRPAHGAWFLKTPRSFWPALQSFRLPLELLLYRLVLDGVIGQQMSFAGFNFDILVGVTAPFIAGLVWRCRERRGVKRALIIWNLFGLALLVNIVVIAVLSIPFPFQFFTQEPANRMVTAFPFVWLPTLLVPLAMFAHLVSLRLTLHDLRSGARSWS